MDFAEHKQYLDVKQIKIMLYVLAAASFFCMIVMKYDREFKLTALLPVCYFMSVCFFIQQNVGDGIGGIAVIVVYAFRMCILPVLCAYGNFWLEPEKNIYIEYYNEAVLLICFEDILVFSALFFLNKYYRKQKKPVMINRQHNFVIKSMIIFLLFLCIILVAGNTDFLSYFRPIIEEDSGLNIAETVQHLQSFGFAYYLLMLIDLIIRPLLSFWVTGYFLKKDNKLGLCMAMAVGIVNVIVVSDRRIISLLVGGCCMAQILLYIKQDIVKKMIYLLIAVMALVTVCYCFYGTNEPYLIARKFQRYFSGPTLTAIGIAVNDNFVQGPVIFFKRLFNDSIILTGLFHSLETPSYVIQMCGTAGHGIWTPMMIGSIQYFSIFAPVCVVAMVGFIMKCDCIARNSKSDLHKLMMNYLSISVAVYMVMYTVELIFYTMIFWGFFYTVIIWFDRKIKV